MCEKRWVERHKEVISFKQMYVSVVHAPEELENSSAHETSTAAHQFLTIIM